MKAKLAAVLRLNKQRKLGQEYLPDALRARIAGRAAQLAAQGGGDDTANWLRAEKGVRDESLRAQRSLSSPRPDVHSRMALGGFNLRQPSRPGLPREKPLMPRQVGASGTGLSTGQRDVPAEPRSTKTFTIKPVSAQSAVPSYGTYTPGVQGPAAYDMTAAREAAIRQGAYENFQSRGGAHGADVADWTEAAKKVDNPAPVRQGSLTWGTRPLSYTAPAATPPGGITSGVGGMAPAGSGAGQAAGMFDRAASVLGRGARAAAPAAKAFGKALPVVGSVIDAHEGVKATQSDDRTEQVLGGLQTGGAALGTGMALTGLGAVPGGIVAAGSSIPLKTYQAGREAYRLAGDLKDLSKSNADTRSLDSRLRSRVYESRQDKLRQQSDGYRPPTATDVSELAGRLSPEERAKAIAATPNASTYQPDYTAGSEYDQATSAVGAAVNRRDNAAAKSDPEEVVAAQRSKALAARVAELRSQTDAGKAEYEQRQKEQAERRSAAEAAWQRQKSIRPGSAEERVLTGVKADPAYASPSGAPPPYVTRSAADWKGLGSLGAPSNPGSGQPAAGPVKPGAPAAPKAGAKPVGGGAPGKAIGTP